MNLEQTTRDGVVVFSVKGRLDGSTAGEFEQSVLAALENGTTKIIFDCNGLDYINSTGLRVLVMAYQRLHGREGRIAVCSLKDYIQEIFTISGYDQIFALHQDCSEALRRLRVDG
ncbi:MAG: anti-sigma factor antagonist [Desulfovibrionales bacterium]|nr:MAG: anti-sigma factor antagonist [Desulfovibrionales bacterium]